MRPSHPDRARHPWLARRRAGSALVAALALLVLASALLASAALVANAGARAAVHARASLAAEALARRTLVRVLTEWDGELDALEVGASVVRSREVDGAEWGAVQAPDVRVRVQRLGPALFWLAVDARLGGSSTYGRRRLGLLVTRPPVPSAGGTPTPPAPIGRWSMADLY